LGNLWNQVAKALQAKVSEAAFNLWVSPIQAEESPEGKLVLGCPNRFFASWVREHYIRLIEEEIKGLGGPVEVVLAVKDPRPSEKTSGDARQLGLPSITPAAAPPPVLRFSRDFTFEEFVVGDCNSFAYQAALAVANGTSGLVNSVYLLSGPGLGKSHLAQAIGNHAVAARPEMRVVYASAEEFTNEMISAIRGGRTEQFKDKYRRGCDMLLLEGVQFLSGKDKTQAELGFTLDSLCAEGKRVIFTATCLPRDIPRLRGGLRSRLSSSLITSIEAPDLPTRVKIILRKATRRGLILPGEVAHYLAESLTGDVRRLEGAVMGLAAKSSLMARPVDLSLAREVVGGFLGVRREVTIDLVQELVGQYFQVSREDLLSRSRRRQIASPRNLAMYLCRKHTRAPLAAIGAAFNRDHATVVYAAQAVEREMRKTGAFGHQVEFLSGKLVGGGEED
jgi:chromosomal replication initiator protein